MSDRFEQLTEEALGLSDNQRILLAQKLILSIDSSINDEEFDQHWDEEIKRRLDRFDANPDNAISEEEAWGRIRRSLDK